MESDRRVALVTGGARRVGRAIVLKLARSGFDVAFTYLNSEADAASLTAELLAAGRTGLAIRADLTKPAEQSTAVYNPVRECFQRLDVLVNNASIYEPSDMNGVTPEQIQRLFAIHIEAPLLLCRAFAPMLRQTKGHVVNMVDLLAERPWPRYAVYAASKAALANLTLSLARELAPEVTVNGIAPGVVEWPKDYPESEREKYLHRVPLGRAGTAEDVAELVSFLAGRGAYISGQIIRLDGGRSTT